MLSEYKNCKQKKLSHEKIKIKKPRKQRALIIRSRKKEVLTSCNADGNIFITNEKHLKIVIKWADKYLYKPAPYTTVIINLPSVNQKSVKRLNTLLKKISPLSDVITIEWLYNKKNNDIKLIINQFKTGFKDLTIIIKPI